MSRSLALPLSLRRRGTRRFTETMGYVNIHSETKECNKTHNETTANVDRRKFTDADICATGSRQLATTEHVIGKHELLKRGYLKAHS
jgi:hypothetical protein